MDSGDAKWDVQKWFEILDAYAAEEPFVFDREQPSAPDRVIFEDEDGDLRSDRDM